MNHNLELRISLWIFGCCFIYEYWFLSVFDFVTLQWAHLLKMSVSYETGTLQRKTTSLHIHFQMNSLSLEQITAVSREKGEQAAKYRRVMDGVKMRWWWSMITRRASFAGAQGEKKKFNGAKSKSLVGVWSSSVAAAARQSPNLTCTLINTTQKGTNSLFHPHSSGDAKELCTVHSRSKP